MIENLDGYSMDLEKMNKEKLKTVFPECFLEDKLVINKLLALCGEYIIEDFEKYRFDWKGKSECLQLAQKRSNGTLRPYPEESVDFDNTKNIYIEGDNLEVLKLLQTSYFRKVKMIYIDPPYNTGNDFIYKDDYTEPMERYKQVTSQATKSSPETMGRFHTNWLNMMYPRLRLAANLLKDDGVIFISIDDNEQDNLKKLCNEIFGEENFVAQFIWERAFAPKNDAKYVSNSHDYIVCYAKKLDSFTIGKLERTQEANERYKNLDNDPRGEWASDNLSVKTYNANTDYEIMTPSGRKVKPPHGSCWRVSKEKFNEMLKDNRIWFGENGDNVPRIKRFLSELQEGMVPVSIWNFKDVGHNQEGRQELKKLFDDKGYFDSPKPMRLLKRIFTIANTKDDDIILDFFSGSGTTAHAVMQLNQEDGGNRQFIMVQLPEVCDEKTEAYKAGYKNICEIGKERIRRAGKKIVEENSQLTLEEREIPLDVGFKVLKLDTSNLYQWDTTPIDEEEVSLFIQRICDTNDGIKPDRTDLEVIYELMLKMGIPLHIPVFPIEVNDKQAYSIGEDCLVLVCFANGIVPEDIEEMREYAPACLIMADKSFADDSVLANAKYILKDTGIELKLI